jgi:hypothetical protein
LDPRDTAQAASGTGARPMRDSHPVILGRDAELAVLSAAADAAEAGRGAFVLVEGAAGIGKTTLLRMACARPKVPGPRILTARGLALESGFAYGIARQLIEPVRASAGPGGWDELLDGAAGLAARVFGWAGAGSVEDDVPYATTHGLYWLAANLAARRPLVIAVDDAHWADAPSLRWLAHLAARIDGLPIALLLAVRSGPDEPGIIDDLRACPQCALLPLRPLGSEATAALVRGRLGGQADPELCRACHDRTGGNPFLLEALTAELRAPGNGDPLARVEDLAPEPVARAVLRRVTQVGEGAGRLARALAVLGGPAPVRHAAALAGQDIPDAARLADGLRAADVLASGSVLEFAHPIVRAAVYESIPAGERALAHAEAARLLERDGADAERVALHLLHSEPGGSARVVTLLRAAAQAANGRGAPGPAAGYLRRALDEPPGPAARPALLLELGLALAGDRSPAAPAALTDAVELTTAPQDHATAALLSARVLGIWGHHDSVAVICRDALAAGRIPGPAADSLEGGAVRECLHQPRDHRRGAGAGAGPAGESRRIECMAGQRRHARRVRRPAARRRPGSDRPGARQRPARCPARLTDGGLRAARAHLERRARYRQRHLRRGPFRRPWAGFHEHGRPRQLPALDDHAAARAAR